MNIEWMWQEIHGYSRVAYQFRFRAIADSHLPGDVSACILRSVSHRFRSTAAKFRFSGAIRGIFYL